MAFSGGKDTAESGWFIIRKMIVYRPRFLFPLDQAQSLGIRHREIILPGD